MGSNIIEYLVYEGVSIDILDKKGRTALFYANTVDTVENNRVLIHKGANPQIRDLQGYTVLHMACFGNCLSLVRKYLSLGLDFNAKTHNGATPILCACETCNNDPQIIQTLMAYGAGPNGTDEWGKTSLIYACELGSLLTVSFLLNNGADVTCKYHNGTALHAACSHNIVEIAKMLVHFGADICAEDKDGRTAFEYACWNSELEVIAYLISKGYPFDKKDQRGQTALSKACWDNTIELAKLLIEAGADTNSKDAEGRTPLHYACSRGSAEIVQLLLSHGADVHTVDFNGNTLMHETVNINALEMLCAAQLEVNVRNKYGETPLHRAVYRDNPPAVQFVFDHGADLFVSNKHGETILHYACERGYADIVRLVKAYGDKEEGLNPSIKSSLQAMLNAKDMMGDTPLGLACWNNFVEVVRLLIECGANVNPGGGDYYLRRAFITIQIW